MKAPRECLQHWDFKKETLAHKTDLMTHALATVTKHLVFNSVGIEKQTKTGCLGLFLDFVFPSSEYMDNCFY